MRLLAVLGLFTNQNTYLPTPSYTLTSEIPTLWYTGTWSPGGESSVAPCRLRCFGAINFAFELMIVGEINARIS